MRDRTVRSLEHLQNSASTARVLNLWALTKRRGEDPDYRERPMFKNRLLNESIIVKHRLRGNELDLFDRPRTTSTKVLLPIDLKDLRMGARFVFLGQRGCEQILQTAFGLEPGDDSIDQRVLRIIDELPSLDPFLLREQLKRYGIEPARCYFDLSTADMRRMFKFVQKEIEPLVSMSFGGDQSFSGYAAKLVTKILAESVGEDLEPLRKVLQLDHHQFQEGVFCWKAFLYYKWQLDDVMPRVSAVTQQINRIKPRGQLDADSKAYIETARNNLRRKIYTSCESVKSTLRIYDKAYEHLTQDGQPQTFREFLLKAPDLFTQLGERLGGIDHIVSFWRFRFLADTVPVISVDELIDIFMDFEASLNFSADQQAQEAMAR